MASTTCFACGAPLKTVSKTRATCSSSSCTGGGTFLRCGYCLEFSLALSPEGMRCANTACVLHDRLLRYCDTCQKTSAANIRGRDICINRSCPSTSSIRKKCFFCGNDSFLEHPDFMFCVKGRGGCGHVFERVERCLHCGQVSFVVGKAMCLNAKCEYFEKKMGVCPRCQNRSVLDVAGDAKDGTCTRPGCPNYAGPMEQTFMLEAPEVIRGVPPSLPVARGGEEPTEIVEALPGPKKEEKERVSTPVREREGEPAAAPVDRDAPTRVSWERPAAGEVPSGVKEGGVREEQERVRQERAERPSPREPEILVERVQPGEAAQAPRREEQVRDEIERPAREPVPGVARPRPLESREPGGAARGGEGDELLLALRFIREHFLRDEAGKTFPLYLVIGLAGSGKTTYLTMLGDMLARRGAKYHFPYLGVEVRKMDVKSLARSGSTVGGISQGEFEKAIRRRVKDLVFDFAQGHYNESLSEMLWPRVTLPEAQAQEEISSFFLVTEVTRNLLPLARIVTFETSGEEFERYFTSLGPERREETPVSPVGAIMGQLLETAEGFVVLLDPGDDATDRVYQNFFMELRQGIEPRALRLLAAEVKRFQEEETSPEKVDLVEKGLVARMSDIIAFLKDGKASELADSEREFLTLVGKALEARFPDGMRDVERKFRQTMNAPGLSDEERAAYEREFFSDMLGFATKRAKALATDWLDRKAPDIIQRSIQAARSSLGIHPRLKIDMDMSLPQKPGLGKYPNLKCVALVVTKCDTYPVIYPPEDYAKFKLPDCADSLFYLENFLRISGGYLRYYNSSCTGYSVLRDTLFYPGKANTLTPINVIEPIFDMLGLESV